VVSELVSCDRCQHWRRDQIGFGQGIGECQEFEDYKLKMPSAKALENAFIALGNQLFWPGGGVPYRYCSKFKVKGD
jgi:hypothetical protein